MHCRARDRARGLIWYAATDFPFVSFKPNEIFDVMHPDETYGLMVSRSDGASVVRFVRRTYRRSSGPLNRPELGLWAALELLWRLNRGP